MINAGTFAATIFAVALGFEAFSPSSATSVLAQAAPAQTESVHSSARQASFPPEVNRSVKGDRLSTSQAGSATVAIVRKSPTSVQLTGQRARILVGCDPAFSNLSAHARLNYANRCVS